MNKEASVYLPALGIINSLGRGKAEVCANLMAGRSPGIVERSDMLVCGTPTYVGEVYSELPPVPQALTKYASRNFQFAIAAVEEIRLDIDRAVDRYGPTRVAVVMGSSTSGIAEGEMALRFAKDTGELPNNFDMRQQEHGSVGEALACYLNLDGLAYTVSTACSSAAVAITCGRRILRTGLADAVIVGGSDSLCRLTVNGFHALSVLSKGICNPMSRNRDGITIGEGAAVFLMERHEADVALFGTGASTDAFSMTAPEPEGKGVELAINRALADANLSPKDITYIQLHGTGTQQNDIMESKVIKRIFGSRKPCSSSKGQLGHTLGAAGAMGAANCWLAASAYNQASTLPPHVWDGEAEDGLLADNLVLHGQEMDSASRQLFLSNTFAFGGNNSTLIIGSARA